MPHFQVKTPRAIACNHPMKINLSSSLIPSHQSLFSRQKSSFS
ncbi:MULTISPECIES: hypothetical protein [unclassified Nostoc]|nr:hypothetical protein [Nostoc sp. JL31]